VTAGRRALGVAALALASVLAIAIARELSIGRDAMAAADAAAARSDWPEAIFRARAAAEALAPGSPWPERGLRRLAAVGHDAEARGDDATALLAYGAMRTAALETSAVASTGARWRAAAEEGLARVARAGKDTPRISPEATLSALRGGGPARAGWIAALSASAVAMIAGLGRLALLGTSGRGARVARAVAAGGFVAYALVMLANAR